MRYHSAHSVAPTAEALAAYVLAGTRLGNHAQVASKLQESVPAGVLQTRSALLYFNARGHHHRAVELHTAALDDFLTCGELASDWNYDQPSFVPWRSGAAQAFLGLGDLDRARQLLEEQLARLGDAPGRSRGITMRLLALTVDDERRYSFLTQAVDQLEHDPDRYELAQARRDLVDARSMAGPEVASRVQAAPAVDGVLHPGRGRTPAALSDAERRVADLAACGNTNRAISTQLCITVSTVEQHLTRIYRKLDIQQRSDLRLFGELGDRG
jgi:DNA-binding NarL/FixJ family response regulator